MPFISCRDPDFWDHLSEELKPFADAGGTGNAAISVFSVGKPQDGGPVVAALRIPPNGLIFRHAHNCHRIEVVVEGSIDVNERTLLPGDLMLSEPGIFYGPHYAGPEGAVTYEIFTSYEATHKMILESADGTIVEHDLSTSEGLNGAAEHARLQAATNSRA